VCRECGHKFASIEIPQETWDKTYKLPKRFREDS